MIGVLIGLMALAGLVVGVVVSRLPPPSWRIERQELLDELNELRRKP